MASGIEETIEVLEREVERLRILLTVWCEYAGRDYAAHSEVRWSDRCFRVCSGHLPYARRIAATDHSYDRTDAPGIEDIVQSSKALQIRPGT